MTPEDILKEISGRPEFGGFCYTFAPAPRTETDQVREYRKLCMENKCGCYGTTWGCPPGSCTEQEAAELVNRFSRTLIVSRRYPMPAADDRAAFDRISREVQNNIRNISAIARSEGIENLPLGDGGCTYCGKCRYPEPCRYPDRRVISISGMGIDMEKYLGEQGIKFSFEKDAVTLYAFIMF